jgi:hypothetical protein
MPQKSAASDFEYLRAVQEILAVEWLSREGTEAYEDL